MDCCCGFSDIYKQVKTKNLDRPHHEISSFGFETLFICRAVWKAPTRVIWLGLFRTALIYYLAQLVT